MDAVILSPSKIATLLSCSRKYRYSYVDKIQPILTDAALAFGSAVHRAIEAATARANAPMTPDEIADAFEHAFRVLAKEGVKFDVGKTEGDFVKLGRPLVKFYYEQYGDDLVSGKTLMVESRLEHNVDVGLQAIAYPDRVWERDDVLRITNYKTAAGFGESDVAAMATDPQLTLEAYLYWRTHDRIPDVLIKDVLVKTKSPRVERATTTRTETQLLEFELYLYAYADRARHYVANGVYPPTYDKACGWCSFHPLCAGVDGAEAQFKAKEWRR